MFGQFALKLRARGWRATIPLTPNSKKPAFSGWQRFNVTPPTDRQVAGWSLSHPHDGVGLCFGPDNTVGVDLDFLEQEIAQRALDITRGIAGDTPLVRVGREPKRLLLYRAAEGLAVNGKVFDSFEVFTKSGQCVFFAIHPDTGLPYKWPVESPLNVAPTDLPIIDSKTIAALIAELSKLDPGAAQRKRAADPRRQPRPGLVSEVLLKIQNVDDELAAVAAILADTPDGRRHNMLVGAAGALALRGYSDRAIRSALEDIFQRLMFDQDVAETEIEIANAILWARQIAGPDDTSILDTMKGPMSSIADNWNQRWGRS